MATEHEQKPTVEGRIVVEPVRDNEGNIVGHIELSPTSGHFFTIVPRKLSGTDRDDTGHETQTLAEAREYVNRLHKTQARVKKEPLNLRVLTQHSSRVQRIKAVHGGTHKLIMESPEGKRLLETGNISVNSYAHDEQFIYPDVPVLRPYVARILTLRHRVDAIEKEIRELQRTIQRAEVKSRTYSRGHFDDDAIKELHADAVTAAANVPAYSAGKFEVGAPVSVIDFDEPDPQASR